MIQGSSLFLAFVLFCLYLKWEGDGARFLLPLFVLAAALAGFFLASICPVILTILICAFLLVGTRLPVLKNWSRPLIGPNSLLHSPREESYFADLRGSHNQDAYFKAVDLVARSGCDAVGIDAVGDQAEYPFQALLRARRPTVRFLHTGVENESARYYPRQRPQLCAVLCMSCREHPERIARYTSLGSAIDLVAFVLFLGPNAIP